jgi:DNA-binding CsgD family transcriptional regulator
MLRAGDDEYVVFSFGIPKLQLPPGLTPAEQRVARGVLHGLSNRQMADENRVSPRTVANQLQSIYFKCDIQSRSELIELCVQVDPGPK